MARQLIRDFALNSSGTIAGRVVDRLLHSAPHSFVLLDASGATRVFVTGAVPPLGALVEVDAERTKRGFVAQSVRVVGVPTLRPGEIAEWSVPEWSERRRELHVRDQLLRTLRTFFYERGFLEVETPTLLAAPGQEPHLLPFVTTFHGRDGARPLWLATSPEYAMKRLLARGHERLFQLGRAYRDGRDEDSPLHSPEFTLVEWYRAWEPLEAIGRDVGELLAATVRALGTGGTAVARGGHRCDLAAPPRWLPVADAFRDLASTDLAPYLDGDDIAFVAALPAALPRVGATAREQADSAFFRLLIERIEPNLGRREPTLLCRYPARHAALAELCPDDPRVANRFEAYVLGIELCNAFQELRDADEQERRLRDEQAVRVAAGGEALPLHEPFLRALRSGLPPCAGVALGVDRLHLLASGAVSVRDVQPFPFGE
ncbi:MAG: EF-P lysine aminoacylase GenX [Planctomycetes bacterium]|nr:EF-P lysine aminoacylase GenX [Planctomycetota bacterium]